MMGSPFDHRQDRELGDALRAALSGSNEADFVQAVVAGAAELQDREILDNDWWGILNAWAKPGLVAAAIGLIAAAALWLSGVGIGTEASAIAADPLEASVEIPAAFLTAQAPDINEVLALELGN